MNRDKAGYTYIDMDGIQKRVRGQKTPGLQHGGARPEAEIDAAFGDPGVNMDLQWNAGKSQWEWTHDDWYNFLEIEPDYLISKCRQRGLDVDETLRAWQNTMHSKNSMRSRPPTELELVTAPVFDPATNTVKEVRKHAVMPQAVRQSIVNYRNTVEKEAERRAYQECKLDARGLRLEAKERGVCRDTVLCRPAADGAKRTVYNEEDYAEIEHGPLSDREKQKYRRCRALGEFCPGDLDVGTTYLTSEFTYIPNAGAGDCLFIAVEHYVDLARQLGQHMGMEADEMYLPEPGTDELMSAVLGDTQLHTVDNNTLRQRGHALRQRVCDYYRDNPNVLLIASRPIMQELALLNLDGNQYSSADFMEQYNDYVGSLAQNPLGLAPITDVKTAKSCAEIVYARSLVDTDDITEEQEPAWQDFINRMYTNYIEHMRNLSSYGGNAEIAVIARLLGHSVVALQYQDEDGDLLETNMGSIIPNTEGRLYLFHTATVAGEGGLHFEIMFPLTEEHIVMKKAIVHPHPQSQSQKSSDKLEGLKAFLVEVGLPEDILLSEADMLLALDDVIANGDADSLVQSYFAHELYNVKNEGIFRAFEPLFSNYAPVDDELETYTENILTALMPQPEGVYDIGRHLCVVLLERDECVRRYKAWFDLLTTEQQQDLISECVSNALSDVDRSSYDPSERFPPGYNENAENKIIVYTMMMPPVYRLIPKGLNMTRDSVIKCLVRLRRAYEGTTGLLTRLDDNNEAIYRAHHGLDESEDPDYTDDDEPILQIMLLEQIADEISQHKSDIVLTALAEAQLTILMTYAEMTPVLILMGEDDAMFVPDTEDKVTLPSLLRLVRVLEEHVDITGDI